jgi:hypothetical protein
VVRPSPVGLPLAEDEAHFRADRTGQKFWDADSKSCTEFIARIALENFAYEDAALAPLVHWAHIIDGAFYDSPAQVVELAAPALQLMQVIENVDDAFIEKLIRGLAERPLDEVATGAEVQERLRPILARHRETLEAVRSKITCERGVVTFDLVDEGYEAFNKFIPYYLHPETTYSVPSRAPRSARKSPSARTRGVRARARTTSPPSANATAAAATPSSAQSPTPRRSGTRTPNRTRDHRRTVERLHE